MAHGLEQPDRGKRDRRPVTILVVSWELVDRLHEIHNTPIVGQVMGKDLHVIVALGNDQVARKHLIDTTANESLAKGCEIHLDCCKVLCSTKVVATEINFSCDNPESANTFGIRNDPKMTA
jgi:hypothetical protein